MKTYSVKEIATMLNTSEETVRRWIRSGKLQADQDSRKSGNIVSDKMLDSFLRNSPKYAGIAAATAASNLVAGGIVLSAALVGSLIAQNEQIKKSQVSPLELIRLIEQGIITSKKEIQKKKNTIKQLKEEVIEEQKRIEESRKLIEVLREQEEIA